MILNSLEWNLYAILNIGHVSAYFSIALLPIVKK